LGADLHASLIRSFTKEHSDLRRSVLNRLNLGPMIAEPAPCPDWLEDISPVVADQQPLHDLEQAPRVGLDRESRALAVARSHALGHGEHCRRGLVSVHGQDDAPSGMRAPGLDGEEGWISTLVEATTDAAHRVRSTLGQGTQRGVLAESAANRHTLRSGGGSVGKRVRAIMCAVIFGLVGASSYAGYHSVWTLVLTIFAVLIWLAVAVFPDWTTRGERAVGSPTLDERHRDSGSDERPLKKAGYRLSSRPEQRRPATVSPAGLSKEGRLLVEPQRPPCARDTLGGGALAPR
jgi:hypothetical protein